MHGWWIDGEFVPCSCDRCATDREEAEELAEAESEAYALASEMVVRDHEAEVFRSRDLWRAVEAYNAH